MAALPESW